MEKKSNRGGRRDGSGRKPKGNKTFSFRVKPYVMERLKSLAEEEGKSVGEYLEAHLPLV